MRKCLAAFSLLVAVDAGTCDDISDEQWFNNDITGWHCKTPSESIYCKCNYEYDHDWDDFDWTDTGSRRRRKSGWEYECEKEMEETCNLGCKHGRCSTPDSVCGSTWSTDPRSKTCAQVFSTAAHASTLQECEEVFGKYDAICPAAALPYKSWHNKMESGTEIENMVRAAALDTIWFYNKLRSMVVQHNKSAAPNELVTTAIQSHFATFRDFSCHRNIPECLSDRPEVSTCESSCNRVTTVIDGWLAKCRSYEPARPVSVNSTNSTTPAPAPNAADYNITCEELGYERDCDGTKGDEAGDYPGLCSAFQQQTQFLTVSGAGATGGSLLPLAAALGMAALFQ
eukprot:gb/GFBE01069541.1/.p1 GENE.gb/GFBE01069541.1/~~gb/GFBE01069541.1/.p1  ORF type:complete len:341 (+),score=63.89 gb/GFBE01069541.1/:1-1023(+)